MSTINNNQKYTIQLNQTEGPNEGSSVSPFWFVVVVRLPHVSSFSHSSMKSILESNNSLTLGDGVETGDVIIIKDCIQLSVENNKDNHTKSMQAILKQTKVNYLANVFPGDWVFAWMLSDSTRGQEILNKVQMGLAANEFDSGLKFVGRVSSIRASISQDLNSGNRTLIYSLQALAFRELDTMIYYDPNMSESIGGNGAVSAWFAKLNTDISDVFRINSTGGKDNSDLLIMTFLELLIGRGVASSFSNPTGAPELRIGTGSVEDASYIIPPAVATLLGVPFLEKSKRKSLCYADILDVIAGIQDYTKDSKFPMPKLVDIENMYAESESNREDLSLDAYSKQKKQERREKMFGRKQHKFTGEHIHGSYLPLMPSFTNKSLWSLMEQFHNDAINEIYSCLRCNENYEIMPTLVIRQQPFTTNDYILAEEYRPAPKSKTTPYLSLPRWILTPKLVNGLDVGRSDGSRCNFVHIYGNCNIARGAQTMTTQLTLNPPLRDDLDIARNGLRPMIKQVNCSIQDTVNKVPTEWMNLIGDFIMGDQLTLNGVINCYGIQEPICEGDNLEWDGIVFHIEAVKHICSRDMNGNLMFRTTLSVSRGMTVDPIFRDDSSGLYVGIDGAGLEDSRPSLSIESDPQVVTEVISTEQK